MPFLRVSKCKYFVKFWQGVLLVFALDLQDRQFFANSRLFEQEDVGQGDASIVLLLEEINYKGKSTLNLLPVSRDFACVLFLKLAI